MAAIDEKIESEIKALLDFSVTDVVTVAPVGLNLNKRLLEDKQLGFEYEKDSEKLIRRLSDWIPKNNDYTRYESLCVDVLKYLFDRKFHSNKLFSQRILGIALQILFSTICNWIQTIDNT